LLEPYYYPTMSTPPTPVAHQNSSTPIGTESVPYGPHDLHNDAIEIGMGDQHSGDDIIGADLMNELE